VGIALGLLAGLTLAILGTDLLVRGAARAGASHAALPVAAIAVAALLAKRRSRP